MAIEVERQMPTKGTFSDQLGYENALEINK
jgi:hypothetical protein